MSAAMASCAARLISAGAGKSGKPCERFTALCFSARRVISRITDSVKRSAFAERRGLGCVLATGDGFAGFIRRSVKLAIDVRVARDDFNVFARFGERNRIDEFRGFAIRLARGPGDDAVFSRIVRGQGRFDAAELLAEVGEIHRAKAHVVVALEKPEL